MTIRTGHARALLALTLAVAACAVDEPPPVGVEPGEPISGLTEAERGRFLLGRALFERVATQDEGLGPLYNAERCSDCHDTPVTGGMGFQTPVLKATRWAGDGCDLLIERGGDNIQLRATPLLLAHGLGPEAVPAEATDSQYVTALPLFGAGLLEAVPDSVLERLADPQDADGDGVSGRIPRLADGRISRFGRKGDAHDVAGFIDTALRFELGLTTPDHPAEETRNGVALPPEVDPAADPEMDAQGFGLLVDYVRLLGPPAAEAAASGPTADTIAAGSEAFDEVGCAVCHVPELRTGPSADPALANRAIRPYTNLLLHDLGAAAEGDVCGPDAAPGEYRTTALWGLRHRTRYMHDGSATDLEASIAAHGGEGAASRDAYQALAEGRRAALLRFLRSL